MPVPKEVNIPTQVQYTGATAPAKQPSTVAYGGGYQAPAPTISYGDIRGGYGGYPAPAARNPTYMDYGGYQAPAVRNPVQAQPAPQSPWYGGYGDIRSGYAGYPAPVQYGYSWPNLDQLLGKPAGPTPMAVPRPEKQKTNAPAPVLSNQVPADEKNTLENLMRSRFTNTDIEEIATWKAWNQGLLDTKPPYLSPGVANFLGMTEEERLAKGYSKYGVWDEDRQMYVFPLIEKPQDNSNKMKIPFYYGGGGGGGYYNYTPQEPWWYWSSVNWRI